MLFESTSFSCCHDQYFDIQKLTRCLAILPKSKGDEGTWSLLMQKILLFVNDYLTDAFQGLEEGNEKP